MKFLKAGLMAVMVATAGLMILPVEEAAAATKCKEQKTIVNGRVVKTKTVCTKTKPKYRTVCDEYWRKGIKYRSCRKVKVRR